MTDLAHTIVTLPADAAVYLSTMELYAAMNLPEKVGRRLVRELSKAAPGRAPFPQPDPLTDRWFWPAVHQYLLRYNRVLLSKPTPPAPPVAQWQENFHAPAAPANSNERRRPRTKVAAT